MKPFTKMDYIELAILCRERGINGRGSKRDLVQRLRTHQQSASHKQLNQKLGANPPSSQQQSSSKVENETEIGGDDDEPKYPPLGPLEDPKRFLSKLGKQDLEEIMQQNDISMASTTSIQWKCFDAQKKYNERALAADEKRCQALRKLIMEFDAIQGSYADEIEAVEKDMEAEMSGFGDDALEFAEKQRNWSWAYEELKVCQDSLIRLCSSH